MINKKVSLKMPKFNQLLCFKANSRRLILTFRGKTEKNTIENQKEKFEEVTCNTNITIWLYYMMERDR